MKPFRWNMEKNEWLKDTRGVSFEDVQQAILQDNLLGIEVKKNPKYAHQKILIVALKKYIYCVPYVEEENYLFLKTIYPDRKYKKVFSRKEQI